MKFTSRKSPMFTLIVYGINLFLITVIIVGWNGPQEEFERILWTDMLMLFVVGILFWVYHDTSYRLTKKYFKYRSGPIKGKIEIRNIKEIIKGKTLWTGLKPATAGKGLIIRYDQHEQIYISPKSNDEFVDKILQLNNQIKITNAEEMYISN